MNFSLPSSQSSSENAAVATVSPLLPATAAPFKRTYVHYPWDDTAPGEQFVFPSRSNIPAVTQAYAGTICARRRKTHGEHWITRQRMVGGKIIVICKRLA